MKIEATLIRSHYILGAAPLPGPERTKRAPQPLCLNLQKELVSKGQQNNINNTSTNEYKPSVSSHPTWRPIIDGGEKIEKMSGS